MTDDDSDERYSGYAFMMEQRADHEQQLIDEERRRYAEEHPGYDRCPKHPERAVVDASVADRRYCAECIEDRQARYADVMIERDRDWSNRDSGDVRQAWGAGYTHPKERE